MKREEREAFVGKMTARIDARMRSHTTAPVMCKKNQNRRKSAAARTHMTQNFTQQTRTAQRFISFLQRPKDMNVAIAWRDRIAKKRDENQHIMEEKRQSESRQRNAPARRRLKQRTIVIPSRMRKKSRPQSSLSRLPTKANEARSPPVATAVDTTCTRIQRMKGTPLIRESPAYVGVRDYYSCLLLVVDRLCQTVREAQYPAVALQVFQTYVYQTICDA